MSKHIPAAFAAVILMANFGSSAIAATTKHPTHKSSDFTPEQKKKLMEQARQICRKRYGAMATVASIDYYHWKVWCREN